MKQIRPTLQLKNYVLVLLPCQRTTNGLPSSKTMSTLWIQEYLSEKPRIFIILAEIMSMLRRYGLVSWSVKASISSRIRLAGKWLSSRSTTVFSEQVRILTIRRYVLSPTHLHEFKSADKTGPPIMSLYLPEQKLGSHSSEGSSSNKFMLKGRQTGSMHRGHSWVFRAESYDTMWVFSYLCRVASRNIRSLFQMIFSELLLTSPSLGALG